MGFSTDPSINRFDPTPERVQPLQQASADFLMGLLQNPTGQFQATQQQVANPQFEQLQRLGGAFEQMGLAGSGNATARAFGEKLGISPTANRTAFTGNPFASFLGQNPEMQAFNQLRDDLAGLAGGGGLAAGQQVIEAAQPIFQRNLQAAQTNLAGSVPSVLNSAFAAQGQDLAGRALQDFNLFQQQALQQGQQTGLQAGSLLGRLARGAGQAQTERFVNPTLQTLLGGLQFAQPMPMETVVQQQQGGLGSLLGSLAGTIGGSILGPAGSAIGGRLGGAIGNSIFGEEVTE